jgi:hypothetical protein
MGIWSGICSIFKAVGQALGLVEQRDAEENTPEMKANAAGKTEEKIAAQAAKDESNPTSDDFDKNVS